MSLRLTKQLAKACAGGLFALACLTVAPAFGPLSGVQTAQAQGVVRSIQVVGNRRVEPETVRSYLAFAVGDAYDASKVNASLRALYGTGLFSDVRIDRSGTTVVVTVVENPVVAKVAFEGNSEIDTKTLQAEVRLKSRSIYTRAKALADAQRILDVYRRQGRYAATVEPKIIQLSQNRVNLVFEIREGTATKVVAINFVGNRAFSDSQLRDIITTAQAGWLDFLKGQSVYDPDRLRLDRELVRQYYLKNGYADAKVLSATAELDRDGTGFFLTFTIDEGPRYRFGSVRIESTLPELRPASLQPVMLTIPGGRFNASYIDKTVEKLTLAVSRQGFAFARVRPRADRDPVAKVINLTYIVDEGPRVYIERIDVSGNTRTKDRVIRREFRLVEGDAYNPLMVEQATKRLKRLGFFKKVQVGRRPGSASDRVIIMVQVVEQPTGELAFGGGYSTTEGVIGDISITERNLLGNGQFLRLKLSGSSSRTQVDLSFTEPRFLDQNLAAGFDLFHKDVDLIRQSSYKSRRSGGTVRLGFPLSEHLWVNTNYTLAYDDIYEVSDVASRAIKDAAKDGATFKSSIGGSIAYDRRNHPRTPNEGYYLMASTEFAGVGGDVQFIRVQAEGRYYYPIAPKITFVARAIGGHIESWGGKDVRLLELYYKGGETIRGFAKSGLGPRDVDTGDALGGKTFWATTAEVRFPLPLVSEQLGMGGAVFADAGSLFGASERASLSGARIFDDASIRASAGVSLLWNSPLGPLRLDYAFPLMREKYDDVQRLRFGASTKF
ncbi:MAG: outer membrane protein assembly factor BamA [Hyphomicrobiaceae bacterium]|nr:outer membrane protein assembly factor BamA [Hyphomicrobiaceae bacterium]